MVGTAVSGQDRSRSFEVAAVASLGVLLALTGPFGTFIVAPLWERLGYWVAVTLLAYGAYRVGFSVADRISGGAGRAGAAGRFTAVMLVSAPLTLPVWLVSYRHTPRLWPRPLDLVDLYPSVLVVGAAILTVLWLVERVTLPASQPAYGPATQRDDVVHAPPANTHAAFLDRLPPRLGQDLIALEMEDHYVRAHTALGSHLILMRMRDAVAEVGGLDGLQVHRSWWVASDAVREVGGTARAPRLTLVNGLVVPVARDRRSALASLPSGGSTEASSR